MPTPGGPKSSTFSAVAMNRPVASSRTSLASISGAVSRRWRKCFGASGFRRKGSHFTRDIADVVHLVAMIQRGQYRIRWAPECPFHGGRSALHARRRSTDRASPALSAWRAVPDVVYPSESRDGTQTGIGRIAGLGGFAGRAPGPGMSDQAESGDQRALLPERDLLACRGRRATSRWQPRTVCHPRRRARARRSGCFRELKRPTG